MKLLTLSINYFRSIIAESIDAQGHNVNIYGANGKGKTSTEDAFLWLLFGKDSSDRKDYDLIPHKSAIPEPDTGCGKEPVVEASLEYFGKTVKLKKSYIEEWPKKGEMKGQYAGSKTHYFVNDLEVKAGEYNSVVNELVDPDLFKLLTAFVSKFYKTGIGQGMDEPLHTVTTSAGHFAEVQAFLIKYYGQGTGQALMDPLDTVVSRDRFGLVTIHGIDYQIVDIGMRMLQPHELYAAQGFPQDYVIDHDYRGNSYPKSKQVARCGNAVPPPFAKALVTANLPELCVKSCKDMAELNNVIAV
nr:AAA family ATPase [uncultured Caproiciproducens sp.]